jgi:hypothetical protein
MKILKTCVLLMLLVLATNALAANQEGGIRLIVGDPTGDFGEVLDDPGFGIIGHYGVKATPMLVLGAGFNLMIYGSESQRIRLPLVEDFDLTTSNYLTDGFLFAQLRPFRGAVQPYAEARLGFRYMWTESKLEDEDWWDDDEIARETNFDDFTNFMGYGCGLLIKLTGGNRITRSPGVFLDFKVTWLGGGEAEYLKPGDISIVNNNPVLNASKSETDMTTYELGVVLTF